MSLTSLRNGLEASYNFNGDAKDRSGKNNHGTVVNAVIDTDNQKLGDGCYYLDGNGDFIETPLLNFDEITISGHFKKSSLDAVNADTVFGAWFWSATLDLNEGFDLARFTSTSNTSLVFILHTKNGGGSVTRGTLFYNIGDTTGEYVHVIGTYNKITGVQKLIIDGVLRKTFTHPVNNTIVPLAGYSDMRIGSSRVNAGDFHGYLDTFHVWSRPLLDGGVALDEYAGEEVAEIYNKGYGLEIVTPAPPTRTGKPVIDGQREPLGYQQVTGLNTAKGLTVPEGTRLAVIQAETQDVMWRDDGTSPTPTVGIPLAAGTEKRYTGDFSAIEFIETAASAKLNVSYYS